MRSHNPVEPLIRLLARLGWQRDPHLWNVPCRDASGRRARLRVTLTEAGVSIESSAPGPWLLAPLEAGRLRGAIRDALISLTELAGDIDTAPAPSRFSGARVRRQRVQLDQPCRPTVADIAARIADTASPIQEVDHVQHACNPDDGDPAASMAA